MLYAQEPEPPEQEQEIHVEELVVAEVLAVAEVSLLASVELLTVREPLQHMDEPRWVVLKDLLLLREVEKNAWGKGKRRKRAEKNTKKN